MARTRTRNVRRAAPDALAIDDQQLLRLYRQMLRIRVFEERVNLLYTGAKMPGLAHLYIGEEAIAVGVCETLGLHDYITSTHRGHGHCLAKGASPDRMFAELLGRGAGYCRGKGGSMHITDASTGNLGANGIVGGGFGMATGAALSVKLQHTQRVVACFFGDGATNEGVMYEVMNMAALWQLPIVYVCEYNGYGEFTSAATVVAGQVLDRPKAFGIRAEEVDGQDVRAVYGAARRLVGLAREGEGPGFLLCHTYRFTGHHAGDVDRAFYRPKPEEQEWITTRDPLNILGDWLISQGKATPGILEQIRAGAAAEMEAAEAFALAAAYPDPSEVTQHVYA